MAIIFPVFHVCPPMCRTKCCPVISPMQTCERERKTYEHESWKAEDRASSHLKEAANYRRKLKTKQERVSRMAKIKELLKIEK